MSNFEYLATGRCADSGHYHQAMCEISEHYEICIREGAAPQDARGLLPTNILTNILFKANLRTLNGIMNTRLCTRTQGEFQHVAEAMKKEVLTVHPWAEPVLRCYCCQHGTCQFPKHTSCSVQAAIPKIDLSKIQKLHKEAIK